MALRDVAHRRRHLGDVGSRVPHALQQRHQLLQTRRRFEIVVREDERCVRCSIRIGGEKRVDRLEFDIDEGRPHLGGCSQCRQPLFLISIISTTNPRPRPNSPSVRALPFPRRTIGDDERDIDIPQEALEILRRLKLLQEIEAEFHTVGSQLLRSVQLASRFVHRRRSNACADTSFKRTLSFDRGRRLDSCVLRRPLRPHHQSLCKHRRSFSDLLDTFAPAPRLDRPPELDCSSRSSPHVGSRKTTDRCKQGAPCRTRDSWFKHADDGG